MKPWIMIAALLVLVAAPGTVLAQADITALTAAARKGNPAAQKQLGVLYASGEGVAQDYAAARRWWSMAAGQEDAGARYNLGVMFESGLGVTADPAAAARW